MILVMSLRKNQIGSNLDITFLIKDAALLRKYFFNQIISTRYLKTNQAAIPNKLRMN